MCTQILISEFGAEALVNIGVAGALNDELDVNDIVISTDAIEYDMDASAFGDPKGTIPGAEALVNIGVAGALNDELDVNDIVISTDAIEYDMDASAFGDPKGTIPRMDCSEFKADERLINAAFEAAVKENKGHNVMKGRIATGDLFVADMETKNELVNDFGGFCCEMEGAAMAHVCYLNKTPYVIIRAMSDKADGSADVTFEEFSKKAAITSANIVMDMLETI